MNNEAKNSIMSIDIENHRFEYDQQKEKDITLYQKSTVNIGEYIFVETIRLFQSDIKYMINEENLRIFAMSWYRKYLI
ncbi:MAG: hypothetical protein ACRCW0_06810 [Clostridium sp.]